jgi:hypothetical protein
MATTTNFGWTTPDNTGYVKDGALAIRTLGSAIDTSMVDLKGGTSGQYLQKASGTDMDFQWVNVSASPWSYIGSVNSTSGTTVSFTGLGGTYKQLLLTFNNVSQSANGTVLITFNSDTSSTSYKIWNYRDYSGSTYDGQSLATSIGCIGTMTSFDKSSGSLKITNAQSTGDKAVELNYKGRLSDWITSTRVPDISETMGGSYIGSSAISRIDITFTNSNTFSAGTWKLWGMTA